MASGHTICVMPGGLDRPFPPENRNLWDSLLASDAGVFVCEFPFGTRASSLNLRKRNKSIVAFAYRTPGTRRHSTAVHLLEAGVEVNVIRAWLAHTSLETTNRYAEITLRTTQAVLEKCSAPEVGEERISRTPKWQSDAALLHWLQSL